MPCLDNYLVFVFTQEPNIFPQHLESASASDTTDGKDTVRKEVRKNIFKLVEDPVIYNDFICRQTFCLHNAALRGAINNEANKCKLLQICLIYISEMHLHQVNMKY